MTEERPRDRRAGRDRATRLGLVALSLVAAAIIAAVLLIRPGTPMTPSDPAARAAAEAAAAASAAAASAARSYVPRQAFGTARTTEEQEGVVGGARDAKPQPGDVLRAVLPERIAGLQRISSRVTTSQGLAFGGASAEGVYSDGARTVTLKVVDASGLARQNAVAPWAAQVGAQEDEQERRQIYRDGDRVVRERCRKTGQDCDVSIVLAQGVLVEASARDVPYAELRRAVDALDLRKLGSATPLSAPPAAPAAPSAAASR